MAKLRHWADGHKAFWCPACNYAHVVRVAPGGWGWNGSDDSPTFTPSVKLTGYEMSPEAYAMIERGEKPTGERYPGRETCCHSFVTDGRIAFCGDCTHEYANMSLPLADWPIEPDNRENNG